MVDEFALAREEMVELQLRRRGIRSEVVLEAMARVPRHAFVPQGQRHLAYADSALPIGSGQTISQPYMVAAMTEALELPAEARVLEVGTGSGYQTAVLAELAAAVYTIERIAGLADTAGRVLDGLGYHNIAFRVGDGSLGWPEEAPFDGILVTAGAPEVPPPLMDQLGDGACLVIPVGSGIDQDLYQIRRFGQEFEKRFITRCRFVPLIDES